MGLQRIGERVENQPLRVNGRNHLLKQELGMDKAMHFVINRLPVIGADPAVINYNQIDRLRFAGQVGG